LCGCENAGLLFQLKSRPGAAVYKLFALLFPVSEFFILYSFQISIVPRFTCGIMKRRPLNYCDISIREAKKNKKNALRKQHVIFPTDSEITKQ